MKYNNSNLANYWFEPRPGPQVITAGDFCKFIGYLVDTKATSYTGSLEEYLSSLWKLAQLHQNETVTFALLGRLLADAFTTEPLEFDEKWLVFQTPPKTLDLIITNPERVKNKFNFLQEMILGQISDLHRFRKAGIFDKGFTWSEIEKQFPNFMYWRNMDVTRVLLHATYGLNSQAEHTECDWSNLAIVLWIGQIYE
jgi:hypothetical protein